MHPAQLRFVSWNLNCGVFTEPGTQSRDDAVSYISRCLHRLVPDVVALQEVAFPRDGNPSQAQSVASQLGMPFIAEFPLSPAHLVRGADLGLAILSRYPLNDTRRILLPNPGIQIQKKGEESWISHDKGFLTTGISTPAGEMWFTCGHLPPFHRFDRDPGEPAFAEIWRTVQEALLPLLERPSVGCIDFNTERVSSLLPACFGIGCYEELIHKPTRPSGDRHDQIICSRHWSNGSLRVVPSRFDHHLSYADLTLGAALKSDSTPPAPRPLARTTVLHLSDLHFGEGTREDVDWKLYLEFATRETRRDRLIRFLRSLRKAPDYVVISGDITIAGRPSGYVSFVETFEELIRGGYLPSTDRIVVVPGNHDVVRDARTDADRWDLFRQHIGMRFVRPWLPACDPSPDDLLERFDASIERESDRWGGLHRKEDHKLKRTDISSLPFVFDRSVGLLIYAFNSAAISGTRIRLSPEVEEAVGWLQGWNDPNRDKIQKVLAALGREVSVDPARIEPPEMYLFSSIIDRLRHMAGSEFDAAFKVAVLHHHVTPVLSEEVAKFESLLNAGRFKRELKDEGFHLVLHGHKHWPELLQDSALPGERPLWILSGGTIGGGEAPGRDPGFYLLEHDAAEQRLSAQFVPLTESGPPRLAFVQNRIQGIALDNRKRHEVAGQGDFLRLPELVATIEKSLLSYLRHQVLDDGTAWWGWSHALDENRVSMVATAYGLRILGLLRCGSLKLRTCLPSILSSLVELRHADGAWSASSQSGAVSQPEPTAFALAGLSVWNHPELPAGTKALEAKLEPSVDSVLWQHVFSLTTVTRILAECNPASVWISRLTEAILQAAHLDHRGHLRCWGRQTLRHADDDFGSASTHGSVIHTAHAIYALSRAHRLTQGLAGAAPEELRSACAYLLEQTDWGNTTEDINRLIRPGKYDGLVVKHFTLPWVVSALLEADTDPEHPRIRAGVREILKMQRKGLWDWGSVERPIWATHDAICALTAFSSVGARL